ERSQGLSEAVRIEVRQLRLLECSAEYATDCGCIPPTDPIQPCGRKEPIFADLDLCRRKQRVVWTEQSLLVQKRNPVRDDVFGISAHREESRRKGLTVLRPHVHARRGTQCGGWGRRGGPA